jgi:uncharacterized membrane protein YkoI
MNQIVNARDFSINLATTLGVALIALAYSSVGAEAQGKTIPLASTPAKVQAAVKAQPGGGLATRVEESVEDGETNYVVLVKRGDAEREYTFEEDGRLISAQVLDADLPAAVRQILSAEFKSIKPSEIHRVTGSDETYFHFDFASSTNSLYIEEGGKWWSLEIPESGLPAPVAATMKKELAGAERGSISRTKEGGKIYFEIETTTKDNRDLRLEILPDGTLQGREEEIPLSLVTAEAQKTIRNRVGDGRLISVSKRTASGGFVYDVEMEREGKAVKFTVGQHGRIRTD